MSDAVGSTRISKVVGYEVRPGDFSQVTQNLPQRIVLLGQPNTTNESSIVENEVKAFITAQEVGNRYGFGSPLYNMMRILRPQSGGGVGGIPTIVIPQKAASGATAKQLNVEPTGTATGNATHTLVIGGRRSIAGARYDFVVENGDTEADIAQKMVDTISNALAAPVTATVDTTETATESCLAETKWAGVDADELTIEVDTNGDAVGVTYATTDVQSGAGVPAIQAALDTFGETWNTIVINPYGDNVHTTLEDFNGRPAQTGGTGRYSGIIFKPFVALFGATVSDDSVYDFSAQKEEVTNVMVPAPNSKAFRHEIAASGARVLALQAQETPHLDVQGRRLPDIPVAESAGKFGDYNFRDQQVKKGWSTSIIQAGNYELVDLVTTYHPDGEVPLQFNHVRNLIIDWNIRYRYLLLEQIHVVGKAIAGDNDKVDVDEVIKPKQWTGLLREMADELARDGIIADPEFMKQSITVEISDTNPDRFNTTFKYKRTGLGRISSTTASAGFNLG
jgi:phage tail sheath gpL-like